MRAVEAAAAASSSDKSRVAKTDIEKPSFLCLDVRK
jgi:hypothetical protein